MARSDNDQPDSGPESLRDGLIDADIEGEFLLLPRTTPRHGGSILMAAMIGLADAMGFESHRHQTEIMASVDRASGQELDLRFGDLPPLN
ncbi:MAG: hypothetical protein AAGA65_05915 [Actinomycetota bacterium]